MPAQPEGYAVLKSIEENSVLIADGGFTCLKNLEEVKVGKDKRGELFVPCSEGRHFLDGQWDEEAQHYVGFWRKQP